jgi:hypothetical protein
MKVTEEELLNTAKNACNQGFPYFKHGISSTPPQSIERDLEAAERIRKVLPDCFSEVKCDTSDNICGNFTFKCNIPNENLPSKRIEAYVYVNRYDVETHFISVPVAEEFFKQYMDKKDA